MKIHQAIAETIGKFHEAMNLNHVSASLIRRRTPRSR